MALPDYNFLSASLADQTLHWITLTLHFCDESSRRRYHCHIMGNSQIDGKIRGAESHKVISTARSNRNSWVAPLCSFSLFIIGRSMRHR